MESDTTKGNLDEQRYISERWQQLVDSGIDPEEAHFRATAEFYSDHQVGLEPSPDQKAPLEEGKG